MLAGVTDGAQQTAVQQIPTTVDQSLNEVDANLMEVVETLSELRGPHRQTNNEMLHQEPNNQYHNDGYTTATAVNLTEQVDMNSRLVEQQPQPYHPPGSSFHYKCPLSVPKFILHLSSLHYGGLRPASDCGKRSEPQSENVAYMNWNCLLSKLL